MFRRTKSSEYGCMDTAQQNYSMRFRDAFRDEAYGETVDSICSSCSRGPVRKDTTTASVAAILLFLPTPIVSC
jgi:hypothetical protein